MKEPIPELTGTYEADCTAADGRMIMRMMASRLDLQLNMVLKPCRKPQSYIKNLLPLSKVKDGNEYRKICTGFSWSQIKDFEHSIPAAYPCPTRSPQTT
jgi:hypothetical protein